MTDNRHKLNIGHPQDRYSELSKLRHRCNPDPDLLVTRLVVIALGANVAGSKGGPKATLEWAMFNLAMSNVTVKAASCVYVTEPVGIGRQPAFLNVALAIETTLPPAELLRLFKRLERRAGRRFERATGSRPLDIDILVYRGKRIGRSGPRRERGSLIVPHPEASRRRFVLEPVSDFAPALELNRYVSVRRLLTRLPRPPGQIRRTLDFLSPACK